jgi:hypothetical protein
VPGQEYDIIDSNYDTIDVNRPQSSNNVVCMEGEYVSVEPDGHLTTNINWGQIKNYPENMFLYDFNYTYNGNSNEREREREREREIIS